MIELTIEARHLPGGLSAVRFGNGAETLVVFPGAGDALQAPDYLDVPDWRLRMFFQRYYGRYAARYRVWVIGRRRGLPPEYSTADMAHDYIRAIEHEIGPAHIRGESLGGMAAQHYAARSPSLVKSLSLVVSARRLGAGGASMCRDWLDWSTDARWHELYRDMTQCLYAGAGSGLSDGAIDVLGSLMGIRTPDNPSDFISSIRACLSHDATDVLPSIKAPALVIGGEVDPLFPVEEQRATAKLLPGGRHHVISGTAHGAYLVRPREFDDVMLRFLDEVVAGTT